MNKLILLIVLAFVMMSSTKKYGNYILVSNESYRAQNVTIYYDFDDGDWTPIEQRFIPARYTKSFSVDTSMLYKYAYKTNNMTQVKPIYSEHIRIY